MRARATVALPKLLKPGALSTSVVLPLHSFDPDAAAAAASSGIAESQMGGGGNHSHQLQRKFLKPCIFTPKLPITHQRGFYQFSKSNVEPVSQSPFLSHALL